MSKRADDAPHETARITDAAGTILPEVLADPYAFYARLRDSDPVHYDGSLRGWILTRYDDVRDAMTDPRLSAARTQAYLSELPAVDRDRFRHFIEARNDMLLFCDGPKHSRLRAIVRNALRTAQSEVEQIAQSKIQALLDGLIGATQIDLMADVALPFPIAVLIELMGIPESDSALVLEWATAFNLAIGGVIDSSRVAVAESALEELASYVATTLRAGLKRSSILESMKAAVSAETLSKDELAASCLMLITAGHETTSNLIGNAIVALTRNPDQLQWLRDDPGRIPGSVDELIRYDSPVQLTAREVLQPMVLRGIPIPTGSRVVPLWGAANRDPTVFNNPSVLDLQRVNSGRQLGFGSGRHRCLGAFAAGSEATVALRAIIARYKSIDLAEPPEWKPNFSFRGPRRLLVNVEAC